MQKGNTNQQALLVVLLIVVLGWLCWYYFNYGQIDLVRILGLKSFF